VHTCLPLAAGDRSRQRSIGTSWHQRRLPRSARLQHRRQYPTSYISVLPLAAGVISTTRPHSGQVTISGFISFGGPACRSETETNDPHIPDLGETCARPAGWFYVPCSAPMASKWWSAVPLVADAPGPVLVSACQEGVPCCNCPTRHRDRQRNRPS
jgi:hypothetical protein